MVAGMPALLVWERIVFPTGSSVRLDNVPAADLAGYSGLEDKVNFHEWRLLKGIAHLGASGAWGKTAGHKNGHSGAVRGSNWW